MIDTRGLIDKMLNVTFLHCRIWRENEAPGLDKIVSSQYFSSRLRYANFRIDSLSTGSGEIE